MMTSHQVSGMIGAQQAMFGNANAYANQLTPNYGGGRGQMPGGFGSPYGVGMGAAPPPPPQPVTGYMNPAMMQMGGMYGAMGMGMSTMMNPASYAPQAFSERLVGTGINAASTIGSGAATVNAGAGALSAMGIGGAVTGTLGLGAGVALGLPAMGVAAAGGYALNQIQTGFQQRQGVNRVLRNNFGGMMGIGGGRGGMGFSAEEMGGISSMVREMGTQDLFTNMEELTRVMDRTAGMGLYRGIQSARDFRQKFRETIDTLKEISTTMGTTLEEATSFMSQGRQMGFFSGSEINANLMQTRFGAGATGLSVGQLQQAGMMGSRMGRMMGMRGRHGAQAAQANMRNIAMGMQMGVFSDEMIAEASGGLTGAEGAEAIAGRSMQITDRWLRSRAGRAMLAGLWDPTTGGMDAGRMRMVQQGQMSIRELRTQGRRNVAAGGGRMSEFFSQEERIRGQLQATGMGTAMMVGSIGEHFARRRGLQIDDPAVQRFIRRRTGMSQGEVELRIREFQNLPDIMERSRGRVRQQMEQAARSKSMEMSGIQGLERRMSRWWERKVENPFRELGDRITTQVSRGVRQLTDDFEGRIKMQISEESKAAYEQLAMYGEVVDPGNTSRGMLSTGNFNEMRQSLAAWRRQGGGSGGGLFGLMRGGARGLGELLGTRASTDPLAEAASLGLINKARRGTVFSNAKGDFQYSIGGGKDASQNLDIVRSRIQEANRRMRRSGEDMGFSTADVKAMGDETLRILTENLSGEGFENRGGGGFRAGTAEARKYWQQKQIELLSQKSERLRRAFSKQDSFVDRVTLLRNLQENAGLAETGYAVEAGPVGVDYDDIEDLMTEIRAKRESAIEGLAGLRYSTTRYKTTVTPGNYWTGREAKHKKSAITSQETLNLSEEVVRGLFRNEKVRRSFAAWREAGPGSEEARTAMAELRRMAAVEGEELGQDQREALQQLTSRELVGSEEGKRNLRHFTGRLLWTQAAEQGAAVRLREQEVGQQLQSSLDDAHWRFVQEGQKEALTKIKAIAAARERGDIEGAMKLERQFYSNAAFTDNKELQDILASTPGMEYLSRGLGATARIADKLINPGRGQTRTGRLLQTALQGMGLEDLGIKGAELRRMAKQLRGGGDAAEAVMTEIEERAREKGEGFFAKLQRRRHVLKSVSDIVDDGVATADELRTFAAQGGAGAAARLRMEGSTEEKVATSALQEKIYGVMKKQYEATVAGNIGNTEALERMAEAIKNQDNNKEV